MPYFSVMLHGHGINVQIEGEPRPIIGFYCTRLVKASSVEDAVLKSREMVLRQWTSDEYTAINKGATPTLEIESVQKTSFFSSLTFKNSGYTFYPDDNTTTV